YCAIETVTPENKGGGTHTGDGGPPDTSYPSNVGPWYSSMHALHLHEDNHRFEVEWPRFYVAPFDWGRMCRLSRQFTVMVECECPEKKEKSESCECPVLKSNDPLIDAGNPTLAEYASPPDVLQRGIPPEPQYLIARDIDGQAGAVDIGGVGFPYFDGQITRV